MPYLTPPKGETGPVELADVFAAPDTRNLPVFWAQAEYLYWWTSPGPLSQPLVTTGTGPNAGGLADPGTTKLIGGSSLDIGWQSGIRLTTGLNMPNILYPCEVGGFFLGQQSFHGAVASDQMGNPILVRPFYNIETGNPNAASIIAAPGLLQGRVDVGSNSQLWGLEANLVCLGGHMDNFQWTALAGIRYLSLSESLLIQDSSTLLTDGAALFDNVPRVKGDIIGSRDLFQTHNHFAGGQFGMRGDYRLGSLVVEGTFKVALGDTHQVTKVNGFSTLQAADGTVLVQPGGLLALPSNSGSFSRDKFALAPEAGLKVGYAVTPRITCSLGYDFLWWSSVARAGDQIPRIISDTQIPTSPAFMFPGRFQPLPQQNPSDFYLHGLTASVEWRF